jgi:hypothetical protein
VLSYVRLRNGNFSTELAAHNRHYGRPSTTFSAAHMCRYGRVVGGYSAYNVDTIDSNVVIARAQCLSARST